MSETPNAPPLIFDRALYRRRKARAAAGFHNHAFLHERVAADIAERLESVTRDFSRALVIGGSDVMRAALTPACGVAEVIAMEAAAAYAAPGGGLVGDEEALPFAPASFDLVVSLLTLHAVNDVPGAVLQIRQALKPDGLFIAATFANETLRELRDAFTRAESELAGGVSPRIAPFADIRDLAGLLQRAGFALPVADVDRIPVTYETPLRLMADLKAMGESNMLRQRRKTPAGRELLLRAAEIYNETYATPEGSAPATFDIVTLTAWAPHESQPKPLKPGSATASLEDAIRGDG